MARSVRFKQSRRPIQGAIALAAAAVLAWGFSAQAAPTAHPSASAKGAVSGSARVAPKGLVATTSKIPLVHVTHPNALKAPTPSQLSQHRVLPLLRQSQATYHAGSAPSVRGATKASPLLDRSRVLQNFDGVDAIQNRATAGFNLEPPDEGLGAGHFRVVNFVNVTGAVYGNHGKLLAGPFYLNTFFGESADANTSDPRVYFDRSTQTWFATILEYQFNADGSEVSESHVDVAASTTADPAGTWNVYQIDTTNPTHSGCPCLADYPILGVDQYNIYISTNEFDKTLSSFNGAQLYVVSKANLAAGHPEANMAFFENLAMAGAPAFHVQPANTYGDAKAEWMMSSLDPNGTSDHRLGVWAVTNRPSVTTGIGQPKLTQRVIHSESYAFPPDAHTPHGYCSSCDAPTSGILANDWDAMQETEFLDGQLIGALDTGVTVKGDTKERSGVAWFVVRPHMRDGVVGSDTEVARQGYLAAQGLYLLYPHINMTLNGSMAMTFGFGGRQTFPSAGYSTAKPWTRFRSIRRAAAGTGPDNGFTGTDQYGTIGRWGDYSNGEIIAGPGNKVWLATEYIPNSGTGYSNWGDRIFQLSLR
jgi:hypothetical protein